MLHAGRAVFACLLAGRCPAAKLLQAMPNRGVRDTCKRTAQHNPSQLLLLNPPTHQFCWNGRILSTPRMPPGRQSLKTSVVPAAQPCLTLALLLCFSCAASPPRLLLCQGLLEPALRPCDDLLQRRHSCEQRLGPRADLPPCLHTGDAPADEM